jgi:3-oxoacyl-[acyl-carrier-protein] synthase III
MQSLVLKNDPVAIGIAATSYYLPPKELSIEELGDKVGMTAERRQKYRQVHGLRSVRVCDGEDAADLAVKAAGQLIEKQQLDPDEVDIVIAYHTLYITSLEPRTLVGEIQHRLGLKRSVGLSISGQYCASIISALRVARGLIVSGAAKNVLLIGVDSFAGSLKREIDDITLQGEGATAALVRKDCRTKRILALSNTVEGSLFRGISCTTEENERFNLLYFLASQRIVRSTLKSLCLTLDDIRLIIPHNINYSSWFRLLDQLKCPRDKFYGENIHRYGHICGSDLMINLSDITAQGLLKSGDYAMLLVVGLGASWACAIIEY